MPYYISKVNFDTGEVNRSGEPIFKKAEFLVTGESVIDVETKVAEYLQGSTMNFETTNITKSKIEAFID
jgi:hypothetical protein